MGRTRREFEVDSRLETVTCDRPCRGDGVFTNPQGDKVCGMIGAPAKFGVTVERFTPMDEMLRCVTPETKSE